MVQVTNMKEIILIGSYQMTKQLSRFITNVQQEFKIVVRYVTLQYFSIHTTKCVTVLSYV